MKRRKATLADVIDLELAHARDRELGADALRARDAEIGRKIDAGNVQPPKLYLAWLDEIRCAATTASSATPPHSPTRRS